MAPGAFYIEALQQYTVLNPHGTRPTTLGLNVDFHSIGLEIILQYAFNPGETPLHTAWYSIGQSFLDALYDDDVANAATVG
jgi:hypothetical protein